MALHFPFPAVNGDTYSAENGVTYTYDGTKWVGSGSATVNNVGELNRGESQLLLNANGSVQFPNYLFPADDGSYNQVLNTNGEGSLSWNDIVANTGNFTFAADAITNDNNASIVVGGGSLGNVEVGLIDELVPPGGVWRLFIDDGQYPYLGDFVQIDDTVTTTWGTPVTATIIDVLQLDGSWRVHVAQDITAGFNDYDTVTFSSVVANKTWTFGIDGTLELPDLGTIQTYGKLTLDVNNRSLIIDSPAIPTPDDIHVYAENPAYGVTVGDSDLGSYVTVNGLLNNKTVEIVTQTGGGNTNSDYWYNILANVSVNSVETSYNSTVLLGSDASVYTIGAYAENIEFETNNLYQKFDASGNRIWKKSWTTQTGIHCGSFNQSARLITANNYGYTQDTILWTSRSGTEDISYVGRMDTDGNFTDGAGNPTNPLMIDQNATYVSDLEPSGDGGFVYIVGTNYDQGNSYPYISKIDLNGASQSVPGYRITVNGSMDPANGYHLFKTIAQDATFDGMFTAGWYNNSANNHLCALFSAWTDLGEGGLGHIASYRVGANVANANVLLETVAVNNHAAYVVANYNEGNATVIKVTQTGPNTYTPQWQTRLGTEGHAVIGTGLAFDSDNNVYLMTDGLGDGLGLTKIDDTDGTVVWSRLISSGFGGEGVISSPGNNTDNDIQIQETRAVLVGYTYDKSENQGCFTIQYDIAEAPTGTYGDFTITDIDLGYASDNLSITELDVTIGDFTLAVTDDTMISTVVTETSGWQSTHWDLVQNQEVQDTPPLVTNTWTFDTDGDTTLPAGGGITFSNGTIKTAPGGLTARAYNGNFVVRVDETQNVPAHPTKSWTFDVSGDLAVPGEIRNNQGHRAVWQNELTGDVAQLMAMIQSINASTPDSNWDGGAAYAIYDTNINADGGFSSTRSGSNTTVFDGGSDAADTGYTTTLNGGGA